MKPWELFNKNKSTKPTEAPAAKQATPKATPIPNEGLEAPTEAPVGLVDSVFNSLYTSEGAEGDTTGAAKTGKIGVTQWARDAVGVEGMSDEDVAKSYLKLLDKKWRGKKGFAEAPKEVQAFLLDSSYNLGESVFGYKNLETSLAQGKYLEAAKGLLGTASIGGASSRGVARRRAEQYNKIAFNKIVEIDQQEDGTLRYLDRKGNEVFSYRPKSGRHTSSKVGRIKV